MIKSAFRYDEVKIKPEHQIGRHSHDDWELSMILTGAGMRAIGNMSEPMSEGEIVLIPPRIEHEWAFDSAHTDNNGDIHNISVFFSTEILQSLKALLPELHTSLETLMALEYAVVYSGKRHARIRQLLLDMRGLTPDIRVPHMMELLTVLPGTADCRRAGRSNRRSKSEERMERVRVFCECNYARTVKLPEVAAVAAMNKSSFCTFIRRHTGHSLTRYANDIRMRKAAELLTHTDNSIAEIAYSVGFTNASYFNRVFLDHFSITPKEMRAQNR